MTQNRQQDLGRILAPEIQIRRDDAALDATDQFVERLQGRPGEKEAQTRRQLGRMARQPDGRCAERSIQRETLSGVMSR